MVPKGGTCGLQTIHSADNYCHLVASISPKFGPSLHQSFSRTGAVRYMFSILAVFLTSQSFRAVSIKAIRTDFLETTLAFVTYVGGDSVMCPPEISLAFHWKSSILADIKYKAAPADSLKVVGGGRVQSWRTSNATFTFAISFWIASPACHEVLPFSLLILVRQSSSNIIFGISMQYLCVHLW